MGSSILRGVGKHRQVEGPETNGPWQPPGSDGAKATPGKGLATVELTAGLAPLLKLIEDSSQPAVAVRVPPPDTDPTVALEPVSSGSDLELEQRRARWLVPAVAALPGATTPPPTESADTVVAPRVPIPSHRARQLAFAFVVVVAAIVALALGGRTTDSHPTASARRVVPAAAARQHVKTAPHHGSAKPRRASRVHNVGH